MSELPMGWEISSLAQVVSKLVDGSHSPPSKQADGLPMLSARNISDGRIIFDDYRLIKQADFEIEDRRTNIRPGDVLLTIVGAIGRTAIVPNLFQKFTLQRSVAVIRLHDGIDSEYLKYVFDAPEFQEWMLENAKGTAQKGIYLKKLGSAHIPVAPLNEQGRIVAKLDRLFARSRCAREELGRVSGLVQRYKQAILAAAFRGDLTADWRENIASTWATIRLSEACLSITDGDHQAPPKVEKGIPFITISAINDGKLNLSKATRFVPRNYFESRPSQCKPEKGDILFSVTGSIAIPVLVDTCELFTFQRHIAILKVNKKLALERYLLCILGSEQIKKQALDVATGTAQLTIPLGGLRKFQIPLPTLNEQEEIVNRVEKLFKAIDLIEQEHQKASKLLDRLEQATLSKAFRGELVPQDPNDEPAAVLLERIQSDRQAQPKGKVIKSPQKSGKRTRLLSDREVNG